MPTQAEIAAAVEIVAAELTGEYFQTFMAIVQNAGLIEFVGFIEFDADEDDQ